MSLQGREGGEGGGRKETTKQMGQREENREMRKRKGTGTRRYGGVREEGKTGL